MIEVLYVAAEDDAARIKERFAILAGGPPPANLKVMLAEQFRELAERYSGQVSLADFFDGYLTAHPRTKMLVLDTEMTCRAVWGGEGAGRAVDIKAKDYGEVREFDRLALKHRAFVGLVNHAKKRNGAPYVDLHEIINRTGVAAAGASGSIVLADPPDRKFGDEEDKRRVLAFRGRDLKDDINLAVEQQADATFKSLGTWSSVMASEAEVEILEAARDLQLGGGWVPAREIADTVGKSKAAVQKCIGRMLKAGRNTWEGFRLEASPSKGIRLVSAYGEARE